MSTCRSCAAAIEWVKTKNGKRMPMDMAKSLCAKCNGIGWAQSLLSGQKIRCVPCEGLGSLRLSHFVTCPNAATHRKARS